MARRKDDKISIDASDIVELSKATSVFEKFIQSTFAEFIGTMVYTFIACMAVTTMDVTSIALAEGLGIAFLCSAFLNISGGLFNPGLTFAMALSGGINAVAAIMYFIFQILGALIGAAFIKAVVLNDSYYDIKGGCNQYRGLVPYDKYDANRQLDMTTGTAVVIETVLSTMIFLVYLMANLDTKGRQSTGPLAYGFAVLVSIICAYHSSGGSFNPARSFGPAVISGYWAEHYIYWAGPALGGLLAGLFYRLILGDRKKRFILKH
ncbi:aquaporin-8 [Strongylocentrotus purpuratus]|uniref:Aquaporin n=1 Tax=Strongylocentrotus purpuratus TaxID=7668 RepID=A0A7M7RH77_STRPU|nr:aquaporin-8-like [Strongylocentrotus purpuratus]XP_794577.1 aquaporin-8 [Strongylocentrotus purpuratus]|eukprot:XP_794577.1 PREDICTED: aquaporin-8 [Strongylocentrotus purpuratus]